MQTFGLPLEWESPSMSLASTEYAFPSERPEHVVFLCFTHLAVAIRPRRSLERVSSLLGKPGSCTTKLLVSLAENPYQHLDVD